MSGVVSIGLLRQRLVSGFRQVRLVLDVDQMRLGLVQQGGVVLEERRVWVAGLLVRSKLGLRRCGLLLRVVQVNVLLRAVIQRGVPRRRVRPIDAVIDLLRARREGRVLSRTFASL